MIRMIRRDVFEITDPVCDRESVLCSALLACLLACLLLLCTAYRGFCTGQKKNGFMENSATGGWVRAWRDNQAFEDKGAATQRPPR